MRLLSYDMFNVNEQLNHFNLVMTMVKDMIKRIEKVDGIYNGNLYKTDDNNYSVHHEPEHTNINFLSKCNDKTRRDVEKILDIYVDRFRNIYIHMVYHGSNGAVEPGLRMFNIYLKNFHHRRIKPNDKVYHCSKSSIRDTIKRYGLLPKPHSQSTKWGHAMFLSYPPAIFATNNGPDDVWRSNMDVWEIDTKRLGNKWWLDLNLFNSGTERYIMTYEPIPSQYIKLIKEYDGDDND